MKIENLLPETLLQKANLVGNEYGWPLELVPDVIVAAKDAGLVNLGGQLQFRLPEGGTYECYWLEIDTCKSLNEGISDKEKIELTAEIALKEFKKLMQNIDLEQEARENFPEPLKEYLSQEKDLRDITYFVMYFE